MPTWDQKSWFLFDHLEHIPTSGSYGALRLCKAPAQSRDPAWIPFNLSLALPVDRPLSSSALRIKLEGEEAALGEEQCVG